MCRLSRRVVRLAPLVIIMQPTHARVPKSQSGLKNAGRAVRPHTAVRDAIQGPRVQAKLTVGPAHDAHEAEADRVADQVMRMTEPATADPGGAGGDCGSGGGCGAGGQGDRGGIGPQVQRACAACGREHEAPQISSLLGPPPAQRLCADCEEEMQRKPVEGPVEGMVQRFTGPTHGSDVGGSAMASGTESTIRSLQGGGSALSASERSYFEPRFGRSFENVRIHDGAQADVASRAISARAFTLGNDIAFAKGEYRPGTRDGRRLLAHELTHTVQQGSGHADAAHAQRVSVTLSHSNCTDAAHTRSIAEGIAGGLGMAHTAQAWFLSFSPANRQRIETLLEPIFMSTSADVYDAVRDRVISIGDILRRAAAGEITFICAPSTDTECSGRQGYVHTNRRGEVNICPSFYGLSLEERKWMIVHEAAHLAGAIGPEIYYADFGTVDCSLRIDTIASTQTALQNADSYARFIWCLTRPADTVLRPVTP